MRAASADLIAAIARESTTLCALWDVTRADGTHFRFTDADRPVTFAASVYRSDVSFNHSAIFTSATFANAQSVTITTTLNDETISEADIRAKRYQGATGTVTIVDWDHPEYGGLLLFKGTFGKLIVSDKDRLTIEMVPLSSGANGFLGRDRYQPTCRAALGDARCTIDIEALKIDFTVDSVSGGRVVVASELTQADDHWKLGVVKWTAGQNTGIVSNVVASDQSSTNLTLGEAPTFTIVAGDTGTVYPGCDKQPSTCRDTFSNMLNFRGEPYVPQSIYYKPPTVHLF